VVAWPWIGILVEEVADYLSSLPAFLLIVWEHRRQMPPDRYSHCVAYSYEGEASGTCLWVPRAVCLSTELSVTDNRHITAHWTRSAAVVVTLKVYSVLTAKSRLQKWLHFVGSLQRYAMSTSRSGFTIIRSDVVAIGSSCLSPPYFSVEVQVSMLSRYKWSVFICTLPRRKDES
jgi:hypothetical protein